MRLHSAERGSCKSIPFGRDAWSLWFGLVDCVRPPPLQAQGLRRVGATLLCNTSMRIARPPSRSIRVLCFLQICCQALGALTYIEEYTAVLPARSCHFQFTLPPPAYLFLHRGLSICKLPYLLLATVGIDLKQRVSMCRCWLIVNCQNGPDEKRWNRIENISDVLHSVALKSTTRSIQNMSNQKMRNDFK